MYMVQLETPQMKTVITQKIDLNILTQNLSQLFSRFLSISLQFYQIPFIFVELAKTENWFLLGKESF